MAGDGVPRAGSRGGRERPRSPTRANELLQGYFVLPRAYVHVGTAREHTCTVSPLLYGIGHQVVRGNNNAHFPRTADDTALFYSEASYKNAQNSFPIPKNVLKNRRTVFLG